MSTYHDDPWAAAENPPAPTSRFFGQAQVEVWWCVLEKGVGKRPFDPGAHKPEDKRTAIRLTLRTLPEHNIQSGAVMREYIGEFGSWPKITLPSIKNLGISPRALDSQWACFELVGEGRKYEDKNTGETKESTTFKLAAVYPDEAACRAAYHAEYGRAEATPSQPTATPMTAPANGQNGMNPEKATAFKFLSLFVKGANGDLDALAAKIASNKVVSKYFTIESPEVIDLLTA